jgi:hypothetical protein
LTTSFHEKYFIDLGIPQEWHSSEFAEYSKPSDYKEQEKLFKEADETLKYQWFVDIDDDQSHTQFFTYAKGFHVALVDISPL